MTHWISIYGKLYECDTNNLKRTSTRGKMEQEVLDKVATAANKFGVSELAIRVLVSLARDPHGIERTAAPSMLASSLGETVERTNEGIVELLAKSLVRENGETPPRLEVDLLNLGLNAEEILALKSRKNVFVNYGAPHSDAAMESLEQLFSETDGPIFVALEATSPSIFKGLKARAKSGRKTIFLMPRKRDIPDQRQTHYAEMKSSWVSFFLQEESAVRQNTELRVTEIPYKDLYTSALSTNVARFDVHFLDSGTTRDGEILEIVQGTTLYEAISARYAEALVRSCPLWRVWWGKALGVWIKRLILPILLLVIGLALASSTNPYAAVSATVSLGLFVNLIYKLTGLDSCYHKIPFEK